MFEKALKIEKGQQWSIPDTKTVDKDAICPINEIASIKTFTIKSHYKFEPSEETKRSNQIKNQKCKLNEQVNSPDPGQNTKKQSQ